DGVLALSPGGWGLPHRPAWPLLCGGCIDLAAAAAAYAWPGLSLVELIGLIMIWAIALATTFAVACVTLRAADEDNLFLLSGIAAALFARALLSPMAADLVVLSTWTGLYAVTAGIVLFKLALQLYRPVTVDLSLQ